MSNRDLIAHQPPRLPLLEQMPRVMVLLSTNRRLSEAEIKELIDVLGGHPHMKLRRKWRDFLKHTPLDDFPGGPLWYHYRGDTLTRVLNAKSDEAGLPVGRRLVEPGEKIAVQAYKYVGRRDFERIEDPTIPEPVAAVAAVKKATKKRKPRRRKVVSK